MSPGWSDEDQDGSPFEHWKRGARVEADVYSSDVSNEPHQQRRPNKTPKKEYVTDKSHINQDEDVYLQLSSYPEKWSW